MDSQLMGEHVRFPQQTKSNAQFKDYVKIARPDNWVKNFFMVPGMVFAYVYFPAPITSGIFINIVIGFFSACFIASANYVINEFLDIEHDKHHPVKKERSLVQRIVNRKIIYLEYTFLAAIGILLASLITYKFLATAVLLLIMGLIYNVPPIRSKDKPYLDVISESFNNPIRFALGWFILTPSLGVPDTKWDLNWINTFPPVSILIAYWMGGAFLMATKRFAELRMINDKDVAGLYRKSFRFYSENSLLISMFFYGITCAFFLAIFLAKNKIELILTFPFFALLFSWYLRIGLLNDSPVQRVKGLHKRKWFVTYLVLFCVLFCVLMFVDIPWLHWFLRNSNN